MATQGGGSVQTEGARESGVRPTFDECCEAVSGLAALAAAARTVGRKRWTEDDLMRLWYVLFKPFVVERVGYCRQAWLRRCAAEDAAVRQFVKTLSLKRDTTAREQQVSVFLHTAEAYDLVYRGLLNLMEPGRW